MGSGDKHLTKQAAKIADMIESMRGMETTSRGIARAAPKPRHMTYEGGSRPAYDGEKMDWVIESIKTIDSKLEELGNRTELLEPMSLTAIKKDLDQIKELARLEKTGVMNALRELAQMFRATGGSKGLMDNLKDLFDVIGTGEDNLLSRTTEVMSSLDSINKYFVSDSKLSKLLENIENLATTVQQKMSTDETKDEQDKKVLEEVRQKTEKISADLALVTELKKLLESTNNSIHGRANEITNKVDETSRAILVTQAGIERFATELRGDMKTSTETTNENIDNIRRGMYTTAEKLLQNSNSIKSQQETFVHGMNSNQEAMSRIVEGLRKMWDNQASIEKLVINHYNKDETSHRDIRDDIGAIKSQQETLMTAVERCANNGEVDLRQFANAVSEMKGQHEVLARKIQQCGDRNGVDLNEALREIKQQQNNLVQRLRPNRGSNELVALQTNLLQELRSTGTRHRNTTNGPNIRQFIRNTINNKLSPIPEVVGTGMQEGIETVIRKIDSSKGEILGEVARRRNGNAARFSELTNKFNTIVDQLGALANAPRSASEQQRQWFQKAESWMASIREEIRKCCDSATRARGSATASLNAGSIERIEKMVQNLDTIKRNIYGSIRTSGNSSVVNLMRRLVNEEAGQRTRAIRSRQQELQNAIARETTEFRRQVDLANQNVGSIDSKIRAARGEFERRIQTIEETRQRNAGRLNDAIAAMRGSNTSATQESLYELQRTFETRDAQHRETIARLTTEFGSAQNTMTENRNRLVARMEELKRAANETRNRRQKEIEALRREIETNGNRRTLQNSGREQRTNMNINEATNPSGPSLAPRRNLRRRRMNNLNDGRRTQQRLVAATGPFAIVENMATNNEVVVLDRIERIKQAENAIEQMLREDPGRKLDIISTFRDNGRSENNPPENGINEENNHNENPNNTTRTFRISSRNADGGYRPIGGNTYETFNREGAFKLLADTRALFPRLPLFIEEYNPGTGVWNVLQDQEQNSNENNGTGTPRSSRISNAGSRQSNGQPRNNGIGTPRSSRVSNAGSRQSNGNPQNNGRGSPRSSRVSNAGSRQSNGNPQNNGRGSPSIRQTISEAFSRTSAANNQRASTAESRQTGANPDNYSRRSTGSASHTNPPNQTLGGASRNDVYRISWLSSFTQDRLSTNETYGRLEEASEELRHRVSEFGTRFDFRIEIFNRNTNTWIPIHRNNISESRQNQTLGRTSAAPLQSYEYRITRYVSRRLNFMGISERFQTMAEAEEKLIRLQRLYPIGQFRIERSIRGANTWIPIHRNNGSESRQNQTSERTSAAPPQSSGRYRIAKFESPTRGFVIMYQEFETAEAAENHLNILTSRNPDVRLRVETYNPTTNSWIPVRINDRNRSRPIQTSARTPESLYRIAMFESNRGFIGMNRSFAIADSAEMRLTELESRNSGLFFRIEQYDPITDSWIPVRTSSRHGNRASTAQSRRIPSSTVDQYRITVLTTNGSRSVFRTYENYENALQSYQTLSEQNPMQELRIEKLLTGTRIWFPVLQNNGPMTLQIPRNSRSTRIGGTVPSSRTAGYSSTRRNATNGQTNNYSSSGTSGITSESHRPYNGASTATSMPTFGTSSGPRISNRNETANNGNGCPICDMPWNCVIGGCGHIMCTTCRSRLSRKYIRVQGRTLYDKQECPFCRHIIEDVHVINPTEGPYARVCIICKGTPKKIFTSCGHLACATCIQDESTCPQCKTMSETQQIAGLER